MNDWSYNNNEEEAEMGQLAAIHSSMNAVANLQSKIREQEKFPSEKFCLDCGEEIPEFRRTLIPGVCRCVEGQSRFEFTQTRFTGIERKAPSLQGGEDVK